MRFLDNLLCSKFGHKLVYYGSKIAGFHRPTVYYTCVRCGLLYNQTEGKVDDSPELTGYIHDLSDDGQS